MSKTPETITTAVADLGFHPEMASGSEAVSSFEQQFNDRQTIESRGGKIQAVDLKPENLDPEAVPIVMAGGWTEGPDAFKYSMKELYERGNRVISVDHPTRGDTVEEVEDYPEAELRKAMNYHDALEDMGIEKADVVAHSAGAANAMLWATLYPEQVRNMVLTNPDGLIGRDSFLRLFLRFQPKLARSIATSLVNRPAGRALTHGTKNIVGRPGKVKRALAEVVAISRADITKAIDSLRQKGHKIGVLVSNTDPVFPTERIQEQLVTEYGESTDGQSYPEAMRTDAFAMNVRKRAGHDELIVHPEMGAAAADQMLRSFENPSHPSLTKKEYQPRYTKSERVASWITGRWVASKNLLNEKLVTGEKAKRNRIIAGAVGAVALAGGAYLAYRWGLDNDPGDKLTGNGFEPADTPSPSSGTGNSGIENMPASTTEPVTTAIDSANNLNQGGDISKSLSLPDGYLRKSPGGSYEVTAMYGNQTDSVWRAAEHALTDHLGYQPSVTQIDALKDLLGEHLLEVGDKVNISDSQIERALQAAKH